MNKKPLRTVKSFVRRAGREISNQENAFQELWPLYGLSSKDALLKLPDIFPHQAPIILEIGFGMGDSLIAQAIDNPGINFLGIEVHRSGVAKVLKAIHEKKLENLKVFSEDALEVLAKSIPDNSLSRLQIFFPDPWPKKRHHKRRLVQEEFISLIYNKLQSGGVLHLCTDWENYAEHMLAVMAKNPYFQPMREPEAYHDKPDFRPLTKYELRGKRLGHKIWDLLYLAREETLS